MCVCVLCAWMGSMKDRREHWIPLELEFQTAVSHHVMLGTKYGFLTGVSSALNRRAISLSLTCSGFVCCFEIGPHLYNQETPQS